MKKNTYPGYEAQRQKGWLRAHKWLLLRRLCQVSILALFLAGPLLGVWIVSGNLNSSLTLEVLPLTDPYLVTQSIFAGQWQTTTALIGAAIVLVFYLLVGGRAYCAWVCPVNVLTDLAYWLRERLGIRGALRLPRYSRYLVLIATLLAALISSHIVWELVNPVSLFHRGIIFGWGLGWLLLLAVFLFDLLIMRRGWCGHLCPVGAFYSLLAWRSPLRIRADGRENCDNCMDCYQVCPEQQVIRPVLKYEDSGAGPVIISPNCTNCGRCIDVCSKDVFQYGLRFHNIDPVIPEINYPANHSSGVSAR